jgi:hypothetical protein
MPMSTTDQNLLISNINKIMSDIGRTTDGTIIAARTNKGKAAAELHIAGHMFARAKLRLDAAKEAAVESGVLFDHRSEPREPGTHEIVYDDGTTTVWVTVKNGGTSFKGELMYKHLLDNKLLSKVKADAALEACKRVNPPAHEFRAVWGRTDK